MKTLLFAYDFPHRRSVDMLLRMELAGWRPTLVVGAPWKELNLPRSRLKTGHKTIDDLHPRVLAEHLGIEYQAIDHVDPKVGDLARARGIELGVTGGARILPAATIDAFPVGVLNLHPGLIPENRGLDSLQHAIRKDLPLAVTAHLVDARVDAGRPFARYLVPVYRRDTLVDLGLRMVESLNVLLPHALRELASGRARPRELVGRLPSKNRPGDPEVDVEVEAKWPEYVQRWAMDAGAWRCICGTLLAEHACASCGRAYDPLEVFLRERDPPGEVSE